MRIVKKMERLSSIEDTWYVAPKWLWHPSWKSLVKTANFKQNYIEHYFFALFSLKKDFISNIKGSLLTSDLYENWLTIMDEGTLVGRIAAIQR